MKQFSLFLTLAILVALVSCGQPPQQQAQAPPKTEPAVQKVDTPKVYQKPVAVLETEFGAITIELYPKLAPKTVANFIAKATVHAFDSTTFHRIVPGFVIQGGDPNSKDGDPANDGFGGDGMAVDPRKLSNLRGTISMASSSQQKPIADQSDAQFFINLDNKCARLDRSGFAPFGKVTAGMEVADKIVRQPRDANDRPLRNVYITKVTISEGKK